MAISLDKATKHNITSCKFPPATAEYTFRDAILYALGIGFSTQDENGLRYLYENSKDFQVFPLFAVMVTLPEGLKLLQLPGLKINPANLLHFEQYIEQHRPLPANDKVTIQTEVIDVLDRKLGSQYIFQTMATNEKGPIFTSQASAFITGDGNFGGRNLTEKPVHKTMLKPKGPPDEILEYKIGLDLTAIFRLSGDYNPIHIEPAFAKKANFDRIIVHGNCTMGITAKLILKKYANEDARRFKSMMVRFANVVYPGDTLQVYTWKVNNRIQFEVKTKEATAPVLTGGYVEILETPME